MKSTLTILATATALSVSITGYSDTIAYGSITDPANDASQDDLVSASVGIDNLSIVTLEVHFRPDSFLAGSSAVSFYLDLDRNPATGYAGLTLGGADGSLLGVDAIVVLPFFLNPYAKVYSDVTESDFPLRPAQYSFNTLSDGYQIALPLADLGTANTTMNFKVLSDRSLSPDSSTTIHDAMSNFGSPVGTVVNVPEPSLGLLLLSGGLLYLRCRSLRKSE